MKVTWPIKFFGCFVFATSVYAAKTDFEFKSSRLQSFFIFLQDLSSSDDASPLKQGFLQSAYNNAHFQTLSAEFERLNQKNFNGDDAYSKAARSFFLNQSLFAKNLEDFEFRSTGLLSAVDQERFFRIAREFLPVFERLVWVDNSERGEKLAKNLETGIESWHFQDAFEKTKNLLRAEWPNGLSFYISTVPVGKGAAFQGAHQFSQGFALRLGGDAFSNNEIFAPLMAQAVTALFKNIPTDFESEIGNYFSTESSTRYSFIARDAFNEAVAKAVSIYFSKTRGLPYSETLSFSPEPHSFLSALEKITGNYIERSKSFDRDFIHAYIALFKDSFPDSIYQNENIYRRVVVLSDSEDSSVKDLAARMKAALASSTVDLVFGLDSGEVSLHADDPRTPLVLLSEKNFQKSKAFFASRPWLKKSFEKITRHKGSLIYKNFDPSGRAYVIVRLKNLREDLSAALLRIKEKFPSNETLKGF